MKRKSEAIIIEADAKALSASTTGGFLGVLTDGKTARLARARDLSTGQGPVNATGFFLFPLDFT
jgi:hypothetical protein